jgi:hypothetical protein
MTEHKSEQSLPRRPIPSDGSADNDTAWQLGVISREAGAEHVGDPIDHGLRLLRLLSENGFDVYWKAGR